MGKRSKPRGFVKDIIIVAIGVLTIWIGLQVVFGTQNPFYVVSSGSMVPVLQVFDVLVVQGNIPFEEVSEGDIIVFDRPSGHDRVIVHRVVSIIDEDPKTIRTKGDANPASIPGTDYPITEEEYIGSVAYVIPQIGYVTRILQPPINYIIIAIIVVIMIAKQFAKTKKEAALSDSFHFEETDEKKDVNPTEQEKLGDLPADSEYTKEEDEEILDLDKYKNIDLEKGKDPTSESENSETKDKKSED